MGLLALMLNPGIETQTARGHPAEGDAESCWKDQINLLWKPGVYRGGERPSVERALSVAPVWALHDTSGDRARVRTPGAPMRATDWQEIGGLYGRFSSGAKALRPWLS